MLFRSFIESNEDLRYFVSLNECLYDEYLVEGARPKVPVPDFAKGQEADYQQYHQDRQKSAPWRSDDWRHWLSKNPKIAKSDLISPNLSQGTVDGVNPEILNKTLGDSKGYNSYVIHLTPAAQSGFITCACASNGCRSTCLQTAGNIGALADKTHARLKKTWFLAKEMPYVIRNLIDYIGKLRAKTEAQGGKLAIRLNGTSDMIWENLRDENGRTIPEAFPDVTFYDYTKIPHRMGKTPPNYHLTFSRSETNEKKALEFLAAGHNVAVVFGPGKVHNRENLIYPMNSSKPGAPLLPAVWYGYRVINGDAHDLRFLEEQPKGSKGLVIGLVAKGAASFENYDRETNQFVLPNKKTFMVMPNDPGLQYPENEEFLRISHALIHQRNKSDQNTGGQFATMKKKYIDEQELITSMLAGTLSPEKEAEAMKSPHYARLHGAIAKIRDYCARFPTACQRDYLAKASAELLKPTVDATGDKRFPAQPFSPEILRASGLVSGKRSGDNEPNEAEFKSWLAARSRKPLS